MYDQTEQLETMNLKIEPTVLLLLIVVFAMLIMFMFVVLTVLVIINNMINTRVHRP